MAYKKKRFKSTRSKNFTLKKEFIYIFMLLCFFFLLLNPEAIYMVKTLYDKNKLIESIRELTNQNAILENRLKSLEKDPNYLERTIRKDLGVIAPGEIEYRVSRKKK
jgi:cell division protein FtsB